MLYGTIAHWNDERGYGFILPDQGGESVFVHFSKIQGEADLLRLGMRVRYALAEGRRPGTIQATNVNIEGLS